MEAAVGKVSDFKLGEKREVKVGDVTALLLCTSSGLYAVGSRCTHYGAPLVNGVLDGCRLKCPWHGATFNASTGDVEEAPAIDALPCFPLRVDDSGTVHITVPQTAESRASARKHRVPQSALSQPPLSNRRFVIVGGGAAGLAAADTLRQSGFQGELWMLTREAEPPYDRTKLSKDPTAALALDKMLLRSRQELQDLRVQLLYSTSATAIDTQSKTLSYHELSTPERTLTTRYDEILVCTGSQARQLSLPGADLQRVLTLRAPADAAAVVSAVRAVGAECDVVVIGGGFIGLELAAFFASKRGELCRSIAVIVSGEAPLQQQLSTAVGKGLQKVHEAHGVSFFCSTHVSALIGDERGVTGVQLSTQQIVSASVVVVAVGAAIQTDWLRSDSRVELSDQGEVVVDDSFRNRSGLYAAGDIARFPYFAQQERLIRIEHWAWAQQSGRIAALSMLHGRLAADRRYVPYFWTVQPDKKSVRYVGYGGGYDEAVIDGRVEELKFVVLYCKGEEVLAVASCQRDPVCSQAAELIRTGRMPSKTQVKEAGFELSKFM